MGLRRRMDRRSARSHPGPRGHGPAGAVRRLPVVPARLVREHRHGRRHAPADDRRARHERRRPARPVRRPGAPARPAPARLQERQVHHAYHALGHPQAVRQGAGGTRLGQRLRLVRRHLRPWPRESVDDAMSTFLEAKESDAVADAPVAYASFGIRVVAMVIDAAIVLASLLVLVPLLGYATTALHVGSGIAVVIILVLFALYEPLLVCQFGGTIGHRRVNLRVVDDATNANPGLLKAFARFLLKA